MVRDVLNAGSTASTRPSHGMLLGAGYGNTFATSRTRCPRCWSAEVRNVASKRDFTLRNMGTEALRSLAPKKTVQVG